MSGLCFDKAGRISSYRLSQRLSLLDISGAKCLYGFDRDFVGCVKIEWISSG